jgi:hypothetical protein
MEKQHRTLTLDNVQIRDTVAGMTATGWMQVGEQLSNDTTRVLWKLQEGTCDPWLAPRHEWMLKENGLLYAYIDGVAVGNLWSEYDKTAAIAAKGVNLLERIMDIILATNGSASWASMAEGADKIRRAGIPIVGKE